MSKSCIEHGQNFLATSQQPQVNTTRTQIVIIQESSTCNVILTEGRANCGHRALFYFKSTGMVYLRGRYLLQRNGILLQKLF